MINNPQERQRFFRFAFVGIIGAVVDFGIFNILTNFAHIPAVWSSVISFTVAVINNFIWNRYWIYPDSRDKSVSTQVIQFVVVSLIGLGIRTPLFAVLEKILVRAFTSWLPKDFIFSGTFVGHNVALACAVLVVMLWNFFANRFWTYNDVN